MTTVILCLVVVLFAWQWFMSVILSDAINESNSKWRYRVMELQRYVERTYDKARFAYEASDRNGDRLRELIEAKDSSARIRAAIARTAAWCEHQRSDLCAAQIMMRLAAEIDCERESHANKDWDFMTSKEIHNRVRIAHEIEMTAPVVAVVLDEEDGECNG